MPPKLPALPYNGESSWHLDKKVPISLIFAGLLQAAYEWQIDLYREVA